MRLGPQHFCDYGVTQAGWRSRTVESDQESGCGIDTFSQSSKGADLPPPELPKPVSVDRESSLAALAALDEGGTPKWEYAAGNERSALPPRLLPGLGDSESLSYRLGWLFVAAIIVALVAKMTFAFWAPAHGGVDQNGYLMGGRQFAHTLSTKFVPESPYQYVGDMWVMMGKDGTYFPKYPLGMPVLYAIMLWIGGAKHGTTWAFMVSPVSMIMATAGMFYVARALAGSFAATLAAILLATSQFTLELANNPNSHSACLAFVVWGMFFLLRWWQTNSIWRGLLAGFLLGYACTIRYTEGLLCLPIALAAICSIRWTNWRTYIRAFVPTMGWIVPVGYLLLFNRVAMGSWTGYDSTNESDAFTWHKFVDTWEQVVRMLNDRGMVFTLPLGLIGIAMVFRRSWQLGIMLVLWLIPGVALYTSYYWSPDRGMAYARFFVTFLPPLILGAAVLIRYGVNGSDDFGMPRRSVVAPIAAGLVVAAAAALGLYRATIGLENGQAMSREALINQYRQQASLATGGEEMVKHIPPGSLVFGDGPRMAEGSMNYWAFMGDWQLFQFTSFTGSFSRAFAMAQAKDPTNPSPRQLRRIEYDDSIRKNKSADAMIQDQQKLVTEAFASGKRVFIVAMQTTINTYQPKFFPSSKYVLNQISGWNDQVEPQFGIEPPKPEDNQNNRGFMGGRGGPGGQGGRGNRGPGGPGGPGGQRGGGGFMDWTPTSWRIVEVTPKEPVASVR